jgi:SAM-dependent methyltransferase
MTLQEQFGQIDIYLFDQLLQGNIRPGMRVLDAGCGSGRNLVYLLREGYEVFGVDAKQAAVEYVRDLARMLAPPLPAENFQVAGIEAMPFPDGFADVVVCNSVLHFARDVVLPAGIDDWDAVRADRRKTIPARRWSGMVARRRVDPDGADEPAGWGTNGSAEDHGRPGAALHDHLGGTQAELSRMAGRTLDHGRVSRLRPLSRWGKLRDCL